MQDLVNIFIKGVFIENMIFAYFLGMCSYLAVSKTVNTAVGLGFAVIFVLCVTIPVNYLLENYVLAEGASGEEFLRREDEEQPEVVELAPNIQNMQAKMDRLRSEITTLQGQFNDVQAELDTRVAAFNWYNDQLQAALEE